MGFNVKVLTDDENVKWLAQSLDCELVNGFESMGNFDIFLSVHGNRIVPMKYLKDKIAINIHPVLDLYKGQNPIKQFILFGNKYGSVSSHFMIEQVDEGKVIHTIHFYTGKITDYAEFYNIAAFYYFKVISETFKMLSIKP